MPLYLTSLLFVFDCWQADEELREELPRLLASGVDAHDLRAACETYGRRASPVLPQPPHLSFPPSDAARGGCHLVSPLSCPPDCLALLAGASPSDPILCASIL